MNNWREFKFNKAYIGELIDSVNGIMLPQQYIEFMMKHNGGEGDIGETWFVLYPLEELQEINDELEIKAFLPNHIVIGSNGGGELYGINADGYFFNVPETLEEEYLTVLGDDIDTLPLKVNEMWK